MEVCLLHTAKFYVLHHYEMKDEINCFVRFTIVKYESFYIIIGRNFLSRKGIYFHPARDVLIRAKQYILSRTIIIRIKCFVWDERGSTRIISLAVTIYLIPYLSIIKITKQIISSSIS
jgi:hypothetical protein